MEGLSLTLLCHLTDDFINALSARVQIKRDSEEKRYKHCAFANQHSSCVVIFNHQIIRLGPPGQISEG